MLADASQGRYETGITEQSEEMIILHSDDKGAERVNALADKAGGEIYRVGGKMKISVALDRISKWLRKAKRPELIVIESALARTKKEREDYEALRRIAKFAGIDVHMVGGDSVRFIADHVVTSDENAELTAPGSKVGPKIAELLASEVMTPLRQAAIDIPDWREIVSATGCSDDDAKSRVKWLKSQKVWANNLYQINVVYHPGNRAHIMIRRLDRQPIHNWGHFQEIKNQILGRECEAVEVYPKESGLIDAKNHYHLWGFTTPQRGFGISLGEGRQVAADMK